MVFSFFLFSLSFHALGKAENAFFLAIILWGIKLTMSILELIKNGRTSVLLTMSSIHNMPSILTNFENKDF